MKRFLTRLLPSLSWLEHQTPKSAPDWQVVFRTMLDFEAEMLKATLADAGICAVIYTKRDRMWSCFANPQPIELWVGAEALEEAKRLVAEYYQQRVPIDSLTKEQSN